MMETIEISDLTEREREALAVLEMYEQDDHPFRARLASQKKRELLGLAVPDAGATETRLRFEDQWETKTPIRRIAQRRQRVRVEDGWLRALGRLNLD